MKKILAALWLGLLWLPLAAGAQQWMDPYARKDGTQDGGRWSTPQDGWQRDYNRPGTINPLTGQFNQYGRKVPGSSPSPRTDSGDSYAIPGSTPKRGDNSYAIPGSSPKAQENPYAIPGSSPQTTKKN